MIAYMSIIKPQREKVILGLNIFSEAALLIVISISWIFTSSTMSEKNVIQAGWMVNFIIAVYILTNWILIIIVLVS